MKQNDQTTETDAIMKDMDHYLKALWRICGGKREEDQRRIDELIAEQRKRERER